MLGMRHDGDMDGLTLLDGRFTKVLDAREERRLLEILSDCKRELAEALARLSGATAPLGADNPALAQQISYTYAGNGPADARLGAIYHRYREVRSKLALANMRLVAHVAKRFRERGVSYSDLLQEGFCGLLEAIDRFDADRVTKLATYATWWIRQAMQRVVASCAYPVRLSPRHLRQLAQNQDDVTAGSVRDQTPRSATKVGGPSTEMIHCIHTATRPTISLDASLDRETNFSLLQTMSDPEGDRTEEIDANETISRLLETLRPREQQVLCLRFGIGDTPRLSLSQVGKVLGVSKERVRQIQDRAIEKLRVLVGDHGLQEILAGDVPILADRAS